MRLTRTSAGHKCQGEEHFTDCKVLWSGGRWYRCEQATLERPGGTLGTFRTDILLIVQGGNGGDLRALVNGAGGGQ